MPKLSKARQAKRKPATIPDGSCVACEGSGKNTRGNTCHPCRGTGRSLVTENAKATKPKKTKAKMES